MSKPRPEQHITLDTETFPSLAARRVATLPHAKPSGTRVFARELSGYEAAAALAAELSIDPLDIYHDDAGTEDDDAIVLARGRRIA